VHKGTEVLHTCVDHGPGGSGFDEDDSLIHVRDIHTGEERVHGITGWVHDVWIADGCIRLSVCRWDCISKYATMSHVIKISAF
jgi:hypothetical protein